MRTLLYEALRLPSNAKASQWQGRQIVQPQLDTIAFLLVNVLSWSEGYLL